MGGAQCWLLLLMTLQQKSYSRASSRASLLGGYLALVIPMLSGIISCPPPFVPSLMAEIEGMTLVPNAISYRASKLRVDAQATTTSGYKSFFRALQVSHQWLIRLHISQLRIRYIISISIILFYRLSGERNYLLLLYDETIRSWFCLMTSPYRRALVMSPL